MLLVLDSLVRSGLPVLPVLVTVLVLAVLVLFVLAALVPAVLAVLVLLDRSLLAEAVCAFNGSGPTRASISSNGANITGRVQLAKLGDRPRRAATIFFEVTGRSADPRMALGTPS